MERRPVISEGCEEDDPLWLESCFEGAFYLLKMIPLSFFFFSSFSSLLSISLVRFASSMNLPKLKTRLLTGRVRPLFFFLILALLLFHRQTSRQRTNSCSVVRCEQRLSCLWSVLGKVFEPLRRQAWRSEAFPRTSSLPTGGTLTSLTKIGCQDRSLWH